MGAGSGHVKLPSTLGCPQGLMLPEQVEHLEGLHNRTASVRAQWDLLAWPKSPNASQAGIGDRVMKAPRKYPDKD